MKPVSFIICDGVNTLADGRFNILGGGIDRFTATNYPIEERFFLDPKLKKISGSFTKTVSCHGLDNGERLRGPK